MIESLFVFNRQMDNSLKSRKNKLGKNSDGQTHVLDPHSALLVYLRKGLKNKKEIDR